jgi:ubiquinone/menaquinone biosynthesis C-methylase UbiE
MGLAERGAGLRLLDLGCGTGASTAALLDVLPEAAEVVAVDASAGMLALARARPWPRAVRFVHARAEELPDELGEPGFDGAFAAFLLGGLPDRDAGLRAIRGLLRPGAPLAVHDFAVAGSPTARLRWAALCWAAVIPAGSLVTGTTELYRYQWRSARTGGGAAGCQAGLARAGFTDLRTQSVPGWAQDLLHTWLGRAP